LVEYWPLLFFGGAPGGAHHDQALLDALYQKHGSNLDFDRIK
jgi:hypothetical protein